MSRFPTTQWSLIELATREAPTGKREHLGSLLDQYWQPMFVHLRYKGLPPELAEDRIQDFIAEILDKDLLAIADPRKGKFRTLLLTALDRFLVTRHRHDTAAKRSPGVIHSLDAADTDQTAAATTTPSVAFERAWAIDVLAQALARMRDECESTGQSARWQLFEARIIAPLLDDCPEVEYGLLASELGLTDEKAAMNLLVTAKRQFARTLRDVIRLYVTRGGDAGEQVQRMANHIVAEDRDQPDRRSAVRLARHLTEQAIQQAVEGELQELQAILGRSRAVTDLVREDLPPTVSPTASPTLSGFWRRLTRKMSDADEQLTEILRCGSESAEENDQALEAHFAALLESPLREVPGCSDTDGTRLIDCLQSATPSIENLELIKDWTNLQRATRGGSLPKDLASGLFYLAIAVALARGQHRISGLQDSALLAGFQWLAARSWLDESLRTVVNQALREVSQ